MDVLRHFNALTVKFLILYMKTISECGQFRMQKHRSFQGVLGTPNIRLLCFILCSVVYYSYSLLLYLTTECFNTLYAVVAILCDLYLNKK